MIEFITGASGTGKTTLMFERIRNFSAQGKKQCILVPEQYSHEFDKNLYFSIGAENFNNLLSLTFTSLSRQLFQLFGEPDRKGEYADDMARMILIYQALSSARSLPDGLSFFRGRSSQDGFAEEVLKLINDMKRGGISPEMLRERAVSMQEGRLHDKTADIAAIYGEYDRLMEKYGFKDNLENIREAAKIANFQQYFKGKCVFLDEFESFNGDQIEMLKVIFSSAENVIITLRTDNVNAGDFTLFETVNNTFLQLKRICTETGLEVRVTKCVKTHRFKYPDLCYLSENIMRNHAPQPEKAPSPDNIRIFEAKDMYSEAEFVCASIKRLIYEDKTLRYKDIAVISNDINPYSEVLKAAFSRYDIPYFLSMEKSVLHTPVMMFFISLLDIMNSKTFRSEQIFRLIKCGLSGMELTETAMLENYCYKWGVDGDMWSEPFTGGDEYLDILEELRIRITEPLERLKKKLSRDITVVEMCTLLYNYLVESETEKNLAEIMNGLVRRDRDYEAAELKRLWGCLMDILDSAASTLDEEKISFSELSRIFRSMIGKINYSLPPQTIDAVTTASARTARLNSPRIIFVMGACEGDFPNQVQLHGLFSEGDKQKLFDEHNIVVSRPLTDLIASERLIVYKALSTASEKLFITYTLSDLSGQGKYPAQAISEIKSMYGRDILITEDSLEPDFYAVTLHAAYYHYMQDRKLRKSSIKNIEKILLENDLYRQKIITVLSRSEHRHKQKIDTGIMEELKSFSPLQITPTGLENFNMCHFMYFCESMLKLQTREKVELDVRIAGDMTHYCFQNILKRRSKKEFIELTYEQLRKEIETMTNKYCAENLSGSFGKTPKFELLFNKVTDRLSDIFLHTQQSLMVTDFVPDAYELRLKDRYSADLPFGRGKRLNFSGIVDRADICRIGDRKYLRIIDYKSSHKFINAKTLGSGTNMQMLLYLFTATSDYGRYSGYVPAGVLYSPIQFPELEAAEAKIPLMNTEGIDSELRTSGLVLGDEDVLQAMEKNINGRFIPVKLTKSGAVDSRSSCISEEGMNRLKDFVCARLTDMAETLYSGDTSAIPLEIGGRTPCMYCVYGDICGNRNADIFREPDPELVAEAEEILSMKNNKDGDEE